MVEKSQEELIQEIKKIKKEKNAVLMAHYYQSAEIQDLADVLGDSLALAQKAKNIDADLVVVAGVRFMAETVKLLNPEKKILIPDLSAGCSLADSCEVKHYADFIQQYPDYVRVSYVNCTTEVKALSNILCTSSNALKVIQSIPKEKRILFGPDKNLGCYLKEKTHRDLLLWDGACSVHADFCLKKILKLKEEYPDAKILVHPECEQHIVELADYVGATSGIIKYSIENDGPFIIVTESGILHQLKKLSPDKSFILAETKNEQEAVCKEMRKTTLETLYRSLKNEDVEIVIPEELREAALKPLEKMLAL